MSATVLQCVTLTVALVAVPSSVRVDDTPAPNGRPGSHGGVSLAEYDGGVVAVWTTWRSRNEAWPDVWASFLRASGTADDVPIATGPGLQWGADVACGPATCLVGYQDGPDIRATWMTFDGAILGKAAFPVGRYGRGTAVARVSDGFLLAYERAGLWVARMRDDGSWDAPAPVATAGSSG